MKRGIDPPYNSTIVQPGAVPGANPKVSKRMDRRRVNGPAGGTAPPVYASTLTGKTASAANRTRQPNEIRKICKYGRISGLKMGAIE